MYIAKCVLTKLDPITPSPKVLQFLDLETQDLGQNAKENIKINIASLRNWCIYIVTGL